MSYIDKRYYTGMVIEVYKYHQNKNKGKTVRQPREKLTTDQQKARNLHQAVKKLTRLLNANFGGGDIHLAVTYAPANLPPDQEAVKKELRNFIDRLRRAYKKAGVVFKYVYVTEQKKQRLNHHFVLPAIDTRILNQKWTAGFVRTTFLDDTGQYKDLASYLLKEASCKEQGDYSRAYTSSTNMIRPEPVIKEIKSVTWTKAPKAPKGYYITDLFEGISDITGYPYQQYTLIKLPETKRRE
jgi:hypothetical protein ELI_3133